MRNILVTHERFLDTCILCLGIEAGAGLANVGQIAVTEDFYLQLATPMAVPRAVRMVTMMLMMVFQVSFFIINSSFLIMHYEL